MLKSYGVGGVVAHVILVSAQVLLVLTLGLWTLNFGLGLDNREYPQSQEMTVYSQGPPPPGFHWSEESLKTCPINGHFCFVFSNASRPV